MGPSDNSNIFDVDVTETTGERSDPTEENINFDVHKDAINDTPVNDDLGAKVLDLGDGVSVLAISPDFHGDGTITLDVTVTGGVREDVNNEKRRLVAAKAEVGAAAGLEGSPMTKVPTNTGSWMLVGILQSPMP